jgi:hypothetical protein
VAKVTGNFKKHPNTAPSSKVGEPNLQEETIASAPAMVNDLNKQLSGVQPSQDIGVQAVGTGTGVPAANEKAPGSQNSGTATDGVAPAPAPPQVNEVQKPTGTGTQQAAPEDKAAPTDPKQESSSKKKGKKGLRKLIPF